MMNDACRREGEMIDILERTKHFAISIIRLYSALSSTTVAQLLGKQALRSGTSVGTHLREGKRRRSDAEMISKIEGAMQELEETAYWIRLLCDTGIVQMDRVSGLLKETNELTAILVTSAETLKQRKAKKSE
jgi:four helix bundle protein